jgi:hypothetical protein
VTLCTPPFRILAQRRRETLGLPNQPVVFLPHPMVTRTPAEIEEIADQALDEVVRLLVAESPAR